MLLKTEEVMKILSVSRPTLMRIMEEGKIQPVEILKGQYRFRQDEIYALVGSPPPAKEEPKPRPEAGIPIPPKETPAQEIPFEEKKRNSAIAQDIRAGILSAFKLGYEKGKIVSELGCTIPEFRKHLESQFRKGMNWKNRGGKDGWFFHFVVPLDSVDLRDAKQRARVTHYTNIVPEWAKIIRAKSSNKPS